MNYRNVFSLLGKVMLIFAALMLLPILVGIWYHESILPFLSPLCVMAGLGFLFTRLNMGDRSMYAKDGLALVGLSWIVMSLIGAIPFVLSGDIPNYLDAVFETVSGFTTTGASVLNDLDHFTRAGIFWRSFTHFIGGMGILVFMMAVLPKNDDSYSMHIMRAEVPGPVVGKLVPRAKQTAMILYLIYTGFTVAETIFLMLGGMPFFDAMLYAFGSAGTGGFAISNAGIAGYHSVYIEVVISVFLLLFAANFNLYYLVLAGKGKAAAASEELHWYLIIVAGATVAIAAGITRIYGSIGQAFRYAFFYVTSLQSTAGFTTVDYTTWPQYTQVIVVLLMFIGGCAGGTGGGFKVSRVMILAKSAIVNVRGTFAPRTVHCVTLDKKRLNSDAVHSVTTYFILYVALLILFTFIISFDGFDFTTNLTAALSCLSNIGPGLGLVGPAGNFSIFSPLSKVALSFAMLLGRLEFYAILVLFFPGTNVKSQRYKDNRNL